jgi:phosphatidylinositol dimannoside acyltransferase
LGERRSDAGGRARDTGGVAYAPHRRTAAGGRVRRLLWRAQERTVVRGYRFASWFLGHVPFGPTLAVARVVFLVGYLVWPSKRRNIRRNAGHILDVSPDDPRSGRLARRIYSTYARYVLELMRLPWLSREEITRSIASESAPVIDDFARRVDALRADGRSMIVVSAHIGSVEQLIASVAARGFPIYGLADDSAYPELYDLLARQRRAWGVEIVAWRNLREVYRLLRRRTVLALLVDWGYRADGIPVRLCGDWTTLPAGPAVLAARTGAAIVPVVGRWRPDRKLLVEVLETIEVTDGSPAGILGATQRIADALEHFILAAPEQWYTFKAIWPATGEEAAIIARRAEDQ